MITYYKLETAFPQCKLVYLVRDNEHGYVHELNRIQNKKKEINDKIFRIN